METPLQNVAEAGGEAAEIGRDAGPAPSRIGLREIEGHIDTLITECDRLREENAALKKRQASLAGECARLIERSEAVRTRVETMIARLRAMEGS